MKIFKLLSVAAMLFSMQAKALPESQLKNTLNPFVSDGCTMSPDGMFGADWTHCCVQHDLAYWAGGTSELRLQADQELRSCMKEESGSSTIAQMYYIGVRSGGNALSHASFIWGYGWTYNIGYRELTDAEKAEVKSKIPQDEQDIKVITAVNTMKAYPTETGNYCLDKAIEQAREAHPELNPNDLKVSQHDGKSAKLTFANCEGSIDYNWKATPSGHCTSAVYSDHRLPMTFKVTGSLLCSQPPMP